MKREKYPVLKTGNFYFPVKDMKKNFTVEETIDLEVSKPNQQIWNFFIKKKTINFKMLADPIWEKISKYIKGKKEYKNCWFVPIKIDEFQGKTIVTVDILREVK